MIKTFLGTVALIFLSADFPSQSIFWLKSDWKRQDGVQIKLSEFAKTPTIVSMVFLSCKYSCPLTVQEMREIDERLHQKTKKNYKMVLISIDPDRDTPSAMQKFMIERKLDPSRWVLISSSTQSIRELAAALGFSYKKDKAMEFAHSMLTWVLDRNGVKKFTRSARKETIDEVVSETLKVIGEDS